VLVGELATLRQAALPLAGALGGMLVPATLYAVLTPGGAAAPAPFDSITRNGLATVRVYPCVHQNIDALKTPRSLEWLAMLERAGTRYALVHVSASPDPQALAVLDIRRHRSEWAPRASYSGESEVVWLFERKR